MNCMSAQKPLFESATAKNGNAKPAKGSVQVLALSAMTNGQEAEIFVLMTAKEELTTRDGKPYFKVGFRDQGREVNFPIWGDSPWAEECRRSWTTGTCYK